MQCLMGNAASVKFIIFIEDTSHTHDDLNSADPSSMQDTCHIWAQPSDLALHEFS